jgi:hypothetical protein
MAKYTMSVVGGKSFTLQPCQVVTPGVGFWGPIADSGRDDEFIHRCDVGLFESAQLSTRELQLIQSIRRYRSALDLKMPDSLRPQFRETTNNHLRALTGE